VIKILIVDDSVVFRSQIAAALASAPQIEVVGSAPNGSIALQRLKQLSVDLITLDMEMPEMDGIEVLKAIRQQNYKVRVIVFSAQTTRGAQKALEALEAGADDVVAKPSIGAANDGSSPSSTPQDRIREVLVPKILQFLPPEQRNTGNQKLSEDLFWLAQRDPNSETFEKLPLAGFHPSLIVIASSTGGPTALETLFAELPQSLEIPILIAQHMPPVFTRILAQRLGDLSKKECSEAKNGDIIKPGQIYIAPGDYHLHLGQSKNGIVLELDQGPQRNSVRPAADYLFESAAKICGANCLGIVLTGMGQDGLQGSLAIKRAGGRILIQDEKSCVVFGMPGAIYKANCYDDIGDLDFISKVLKNSSNKTTHKAT
jgi:two-component system chemotaxis response regulator CheB